MGHMHEHLDAKRLASLAQDPDYTPNHADKVDAAMLHLNGLLAERAVFNTAGQALDASRRDAFQAIQRDTAPVRVVVAYEDDLDDGQFTSAQSLGDHATVSVVYRSDDEGLRIEGAIFNRQFVSIDFFTEQVRCDWYAAISSEERLSSASANAETAESWGE